MRQLRQRTRRSNFNLVSLVLGFSIVVLMSGCGPRQARPGTIDTGSVQDPAWATATPVHYATQPPNASESTTIPASADVTTAVRSAAIAARLPLPGALTLLQVYVRPDRKATPAAIFDSLKPAGCWIVAYKGFRGSRLATITLGIVRPLEGTDWRYEVNWVMPPGMLAQDTGSLARALAGRKAVVRYLWASWDLQWWVIRFEDGTENALPVMHRGIVYVAGQALEDRLYSARIIYDETRSSAGSASR